MSEVDRIRVNCINCGVVILTFDDIIIAEIKSDYDSLCDFVCRHCNTIQMIRISLRMVRVLKDAGVNVVYHEHLEKYASTFKYQDILDFSKMLESGDWIEDLRRNM